MRSVVVCCLRQFLAASLVFPPFICIQDQLHFSVQHCHGRQCRKLTFFLRSCDDSSEAFPSTSSKSKPADIRSPTQESKQTSQESASASNRQALNRHQLKMFQFTMDGSKLEDSESSASPTEFCSGCERQNFNQISARLFF